MMPLTLIEAGQEVEILSRALDGDHFVGLALDLDNQAELSDERLEAWAGQLKAAFA
ncbi:MAG: hypothetical protein ACOCXA_05635 [Planctomycetota bacterium]